VIIAQIVKVIRVKKDVEIKGEEFPGLLVQLR